MAGCTPRAERAMESLRAGEMLLLYGDNEGAIAAFDEAISLNPELAEAYLQRGNAWFNLRDSDKAVDDYTTAVEVSPALADAWFNRGNVWFFLKEYDKACADWKKAEELGKPNVRDKTRFCPDAS